MYTVRFGDLFSSVGLLLRSGKGRKKRGEGGLSVMLYKAYLKQISVSDSGHIPKLFYMQIFQF